MVDLRHVQDLDGYGYYRWQMISVTTERAVDFGHVFRGFYRADQDYIASLLSYSLIYLVYPEKIDVVDVVKVVDRIVKHRNTGSLWADLGQ